MWPWRKKAEEERQHQALLDLVREEQRLNRTLVTVVENQAAIIQDLLARGRTTYPQTIGMKIDPS